jgi:hypothetical protein
VRDGLETDPFAAAPPMFGYGVQVQISVHETHALLGRDAVSVICTDGRPLEKSCGVALYCRVVGMVWISVLVPLVPCARSDCPVCVDDPEAAARRAKMLAGGA